jgi:hypothetical protein
MRQRPIDDAWAQQLLDRAKTGWGARSFRPGRGGWFTSDRLERGGVWLALLIAMGHRLLRPVPKQARPRRTRQPCPLRSCSGEPGIQAVRDTAAAARARGRRQPTS